MTPTDQCRTSKPCAHAPACLSAGPLVSFAMTVLAAMLTSPPATAQPAEQSDPASWHVRGFFESQWAARAAAQRLRTTLPAAIVFDDFPLGVALFAQVGGVIAPIPEGGSLTNANLAPWAILDLGPRYAFVSEVVEFSVEARFGAKWRIQVDQWIPVAEAATRGSAWQHLFWTGWITLALNTDGLSGPGPIEFYEATLTAGWPDVQIGGFVDWFGDTRLGLLGRLKTAYVQVGLHPEPSVGLGIVIPFGGGGR